jgi:polyribonucleotide nucleotidyltransferase
MQKQPHNFSTTVGGRTFTFETGRYAGQAGGAVTVTLGESVVFAAATMSPNAREGIDFFPLSVDYEERLYAGGRIPGSFFRREGRPGADAILVSRLTDRPIRPLFPKNMRNEVQVIIYSFSADDEHPLDILAINAASAALAISDIPWEGPIGAVRVGYLDGQFVINPSYAQIDESALDLRIAGTRDAILMVEAGANEFPEDLMVKALEIGHQAIQPIVDLIEKMAAEVGKPKGEIIKTEVDEALNTEVYNRVKAEIYNRLETPHTKAELYNGIDALEAQTVEEMTAGSEDETLPRKVKNGFQEAYKRVIRDRILLEGKRPDGREKTQIRDIWCDINTIPRAHGSGVFTRGETQVLTFATLGTPKEAQEIDSLAPVTSKRYMHHYNFPSFSTGEVKMLRGQSRREIGHGALAERALVPVIPDEQDFPYTIRLVSEVLSSNGSSSMASVCGSTLALMDCGVPIKAPVTGIAMGLIKEGDKYIVLTDIAGIEDHLGDMDFKVAGTEEGITALQMDIKIKGITPQIMSEAIAQANTAREVILEKMLDVIDQPRPELKSFVPRITIVKIPVDKIGAIIGPGGKNIRSLQEETGTKIDIGEDGSVFIAATNAEAEQAARERILMFSETPEIGRIYTGKVVRVVDFGAFVEILPHQDGMVHISQLDTERVERVEDIANVGDELTVMVTDIDAGGKIRLSRVAVLEGWTVEEAMENDRGGKRTGGGSGGGGRRDGGRRDSGRRDGGRSGGGRDSGRHNR